MFQKIQQIFGLTTLQETRLLPRAGHVIVKKGQSVTAQEVVAEALVGTKHLLIDVTQNFNLPPEKAQAAIKCKEGQRLKKGDVLAQHAGLIPRTLRAPEDARVLLVNDGKIFLETARRGINLQAGLPGRVVEVYEGLGITIEAQGALIQGLWGNQRIESGQLQIAIEKPNDVLKSDDVDVSRRGSIVVGGHCHKADTLQMARDSAIRGLILSSITPDLVPQAMKMPYPIMTTDGIGRRAMNLSAFKLLTSNANREATIFAQRFDYYKGTYPKVLLQITGASNFPEHDVLGVVEEGQRVIIIAAPYTGSTGFVRALPKKKTTLPNGVHTYVAHVELENGEKVIVPLSNLEIIQ